MMKKVFIDNRGNKIAGVLHLPKDKTDKIVVMAHGFVSDKDRPRYIGIAQLLAENGFAALRFDFGGCGESYKSGITVRGWVEDLTSAINFVKEEGYSKIGLIGYSLGALISLEVYNSIIKSILLFAPVTKGADRLQTILDEDKVSRADFEKQGYVIKTRRGREFKIEKEYFEERKAVNQKELLSRVKCPVLIVHGSEDDSVPLSHSEKAMNYLSSNSELKIIQGADHHLEIIHGIDKMALDWFKRYLK